MTRKQAWRYKCDFCGKVGYSGGYMAKHEKCCTANPDRVCRMCKLIEVDQKPIADLVAAAKRGLKALEEEAEGCPACMLAAIRRMPIHYPGGYPDDFGDELSNWKFKDAMKSAMEEVNIASQGY